MVDLQRAVLVTARFLDLRQLVLKLDVVGAQAEQHGREFHGGFPVTPGTRQVQSALVELARLVHLPRLAVGVGHGADDLVVLGHDVEQHAVDGDGGAMLTFT